MTRTNRLDQITVGDVRALIHFDGAEDTPIGDALDQIAAANQAAAAHELDVRAFDAYRLRREQRQGAALAEAAAAADKANRGESDGAKMAGRRQARQDAFEHFQIAEPPLDFQQWVDLGKPDVHEINVPRPTRVQRAAGAVVGLVS